TTVLRRGDEQLVVATDPGRDAAEQRLRAVGQGGKLAGWLGTSWFVLRGLCFVVSPDGEHSQAPNWRVPGFTGAEALEPVSSRRILI
ncbi:hypothetical protein, partial [Streptomyces phaeochromogenes]|uniref:hypothetical protein n=1 Tax=Streptomyces phaeochromogenes TaxID=1923 RepID=UPI0012FE983E